MRGGRKKYRVRNLTELNKGDRVWVKSPTDVGREGFVVRKDTHPDSFWVRVGDSELRRNRKHLFLLKGTSEYPEPVEPPSGDSGETLMMADTPDANNILFSDSPSASTNLGVVTPDNAPASHNQSECDESEADYAEPADLETNPLELLPIINDY